LSNSENDFGLVNKDFIKPATERMQIISWKSHHPNTTFKSILFGEAIKLRRLNRRKEYYLTSLNRLLKLSFGHANDMIAMESKWEDCPQRYEKKGDPHIWAIYVLSPSANSIKKR